MSKSKRPKISTDAAPLRSNPFAALLPDLPDLPEGEEAPAEESPPRPPSDEPGLEQRLVVRRQKRGQGGKTVTCVEGLPAARLADLSTRMKRELGCSARVDEAVLVLGTGDHTRVAQWLRQAGATRVVLGN